jgi:hypothetical protein
MKKTLLPLFIFSLLCLSKIYAQQTFSDAIKIDNGFTLRGIIVQATNSNFLTAITIDSGLYITRLKKTGDIIWERLYGTGTGESINISETPDNGFVCYGYMNNTVTGNHQLTLFKCDSTGKIEWSKSLKLDYSNYYIYPDNLLVDSRGNYVIVYRMQPHTSSTQEMRLLKFDKAGNLIFETGFKNLYNSSYQYLHVTAITESFEGGYLIALNYQEAFLGISRSYLLLTDPSGNEISYRPFNLNLLGVEDYNTPICFFKNKGKYQVLGYYNHFNGRETKEYYYITSVDKNETITNGILIPYNGFALRQYLTKNKISLHNVDGYVINPNYIAVLNYQINDTYINKYDSAGRICPDYTLPDYVYKEIPKTFYLDSEITGARKVIENIETVDGGITVKDIHLMRTVCSGDASALIASGVLDKATTATNTTIFPNPAHNSINISVASIKNKQLQLFNAEGKLLQSISLKQNVTTLDISAYKNGFYLVRISGDNKTETLKFIKE